MKNYTAQECLKMLGCFTPVILVYNWCFSARLDKFYESWRWEGWEGEVEKVAGDQALSIAPPLWARGPKIGLRSRRPMPVAELFGMNVGTL